LNERSETRIWPAIREPLLYRLSRLFVGLGMRGYFKSIEVAERRHIPAHGPVIFACNHPHSITDALVLGYGTGRMLHFLAHSGLFSMRLKAWFLRNSGVIPIYRARDVADAADANIAMFAACHEVLGQGGAIGIFPEGTSAEERRVQKLKTGTARIALGAEHGSGWSLGVQIVPVGLNFESSNRFRSRILIRFGAPLFASAYQTTYTADPIAAATALTADLQQALQREVVNVEQTESEQLVRDVEEIYRDELLGRSEIRVPGATHFQKSQAVSREFARALDYFQDTNPEILWGFSRRLRRYNTMRKTMKLKDDMLRSERGPGVRKELGRILVMGLAGLPWALLGLIGNYVPYRLTGLLTRRLAPDRTKIHFTQFMLGCLFFIPWYAWAVRTALDKLSTFGAVLLILALPPAGLFARGYFRYLGRRRQMLRFARLELVHGLRVGDMRRQRRALIQELDAAMADYLSATQENA
jgi:1-acyl-sn-glycerol-3-phosphate acyltransferase